MVCNEKTRSKMNASSFWYFSALLAQHPLLYDYILELYPQRCIGEADSVYKLTECEILNSFLVTNVKHMQEIEIFWSVILATEFKDFM